MSNDFFNRQELIDWWDQDKIRHARILVAGAGALGNEVIKNLSLLGIGHLIIVDFDVIEDSNLSRTPLFRVEDSARKSKKALVAASRARELNPNSNASIKGLDKDIVWELGYGTYRHADLILGCLDNIEARLSINLNCWRTNRTWIDGGMQGLSGSVTVYDSSSEKPCYECSMTPEHYRMAKVRYSCTGQTVKAAIQQGREPTTQTTSAVIAAIQSQEAIKLLHGLASFPGRQLVFNGSPHFYNDADFSPIVMNQLTLNKSCLCHMEEKYHSVLELREASAETTTVPALIELVKVKTGLINLTVELGHEYVTRAFCQKCNWSISVNKPLFRVYDSETTCPYCETTCPTCGYISKGQPDCPNCGQTDISEARLESFHSIFLENQKTEPYLDKSLQDLGVPPLHVLRMYDKSGKNLFVELSGDLNTYWG